MTMKMKLKGCPMYLFCKLIWSGSVYPHPVEKNNAKLLHGDCMGWRMKPFPLVIVTIQSNGLRNKTSLNILSITLQGNAGVPGKNGEAGEMVR